MCFACVSAICCQKRKQSGKGDKFYKAYFLKKGFDRFSKKLCLCNVQDVSFRVACFTCKDASDPFQRTVHAKYGSGSRSGHEGSQKVTRIKNSF